MTASPLEPVCTLAGAASGPGFRTFCASYSIESSLRLSADSLTHSGFTNDVRMLLNPESPGIINRPTEGQPSCNPTAYSGSLLPREQPRRRVLAPPMGCRATRESAQWGPDGPRTGCRCSGSTPITHTEAVEPSADPSRWRCGRAGFQTGGVENQILKLAVWKLQKSVGGVEAANWRCRNFNPCSRARRSASSRRPARA